MAVARVKNIYWMLAYAFQVLRQGEYESLGAEDFDTLHDLFAAILARGVAAQVRRGLHRDYVQRVDELAGVRGQIRFDETIRRQALVKGRLVCGFDEFLVDTPHNQALKSVMRLLLRQSDLASSSRESLRRLMSYLEEVTDVAPASIRWDAIPVHRNNASYQMLLGICRLVVEGLLLSEAGGTRRLRKWFDDETMSSLYERFVRAYYRHHHPEFGPTAQYIPWDLVDGPRDALLPVMKTDVTMRYGERVLIIDTKWYGQALQRRHHSDHDTYRSDHLYQIHAYVKNADPGRTGNVAGVLLYAKTDEPVSPDADLVVGGNPISVKTLDLDLEWPAVCNQLDGLCSWLVASGDTA